MGRPDLEELRRRTGVVQVHRSRVEQEEEPVAWWATWVAVGLVVVGVGARLWQAAAVGGVAGVFLGFGELVLAAGLGVAGAYVPTLLFDDEPEHLPHAAVRVLGLCCAAPALAGALRAANPAADDGGGPVISIYGIGLVWLLGSLVLLRGEKRMLLVVGLGGMIGQLTVTLLIAQKAARDSGLLFAR